MLVKDLLLHVLIILTPILIYQMMEDKLNQRIMARRRDITVGILAGVASGVCMLFPVKLGNGVIWDLRFVPLLFTILYFNYRAWGPALIAILAFRSIHWGGAVLIAYGTAIAVCALVLLFQRLFRKATKRVKTGLLAILGVLSQFISWLGLLWYVQFTTGSLTHFFKTYSISFFLMVTCVQIATSVLVMFMIELIIESARLRDQAQRGEKLAVTAQMAASIAHEIRNPITAARGFLQLLRDKTDEQGKAYVTIAIDELDRAESIINGYLDLAKPKLTHVVVFNVASTVNRVVEIMEPFAAMHGATVVVRAGQRLFVRGDADKLKQGLVNIVRNSIEAGSTRVEIEVSLVGKRVVIAISDNGPGMTHQILERIGTPFYSTKAKGTGLGLMATDKLVRAMGGTLHFASKVGEGTSARVSLPAATKVAEPSGSML